MKWKHLKILRIVISLLFFLPVCFIYLDIANQIPAWFAILWSSFQVAPSFIKIFFYTGAASAGLYLVLLITALFGRVYCSTVCPLGTYQDIIIRLSRTFRRRQWFKYRKPAYAVHYGLFTMIVFSGLSGSVLLLNIVEPFSTFGRILNTLISPIIILFNNAAALLLIGNDIFILFPVQYQTVILPVLAAIIVCTAAVTYFSFFHGRIFCNLLCPAGALLGVVSRLSLYKMVINEDECTHCKLCEKVCKANCIDSETQTIDFAACIGCFNCMDACHTDGVIYQPRWGKAGHVFAQPVIESRRAMLRSTALSLATAFIPIADTTHSGIGTLSGFEENRKHPVTPPGSKNIERFSSLCTACQLCVTSCPTKVLQPAFFDYGVSGILQPKMDYDRSFCNYDCTRCTEVCPTGAILPLGAAEKKVTQLGRAKFFKDDCIVITKKKDCGACSEHCPTKAVNMVPYEGIFLPKVNEEICTGCGACEHSCPTTPRKAIYVEANPIHRIAEKPKIQKPKENIRIIEEFPF